MLEGNGDEYEGIPVRDLRIESVDWRHRADHVRVRSKRKGTTEFDIEPEWATEATRDPNRLIATTGGRSIKVLGRSVSAPARTSGEWGRLLKVWLIPKDLEQGEWWGASACEANESERRKYARRM